MRFTTKLKHLVATTLRRTKWRETLSRHTYTQVHHFGDSSTRKSMELSPVKHALAWVRAAELPTGGIRVHSNHPNAYPEVTGYLVPTLLHYDERELAIRLVRWLFCIQNADGSYPGPDDGKPYVFDTGQVLHGLLAAIDTVPEAHDAACRAASFLY